MKMRPTILIAIVFLLLASSARLPAPIVEEDKATPPPQEQAPPKAKHSKKPTSDESKVPVKPRTSPAKQSRFAGDWTGVMPTIPWGNLPSVVTIDSSETLMAMSWYEAGEPGSPKTYRHFKAAPESERGHAAAKLAFAAARLEGDTLTATFPAPVLGSSTWSITPQPDGTTARVRMRAFMNDFTAVFHRTATSSSTTKPTR
jgi:hypothetical protein